jgi:hypothetical protein
MNCFAEIPKITELLRAADDVDVKSGGGVRLCANSLPVF